MNKDRVPADFVDMPAINSGGPARAAPEAVKQEPATAAPAPAPAPPAIKEEPASSAGCASGVAPALPVTAGVLGGKSRFPRTPVSSSPSFALDAETQVDAERRVDEAAAAMRAATDERADDVAALKRPAAANKRPAAAEIPAMKVASRKRPAAAAAGEVPAGWGRTACGKLLGCGKCRRIPGGCKKCRNPAFSGRRGP